MDVEELQAVLARHLRHLDGQGQVVGRVLEQRIGGHVDLVEADVLLEVGEAEGQAIGDEVHVVAPARELLAELGRHRSRAPHRGIARDAEPHR